MITITDYNVGERTNEPRPQITKEQWKENNSKMWKFLKDSYIEEYLKEPPTTKEIISDLREKEMKLLQELNVVRTAIKYQIEKQFTKLG